MQRANSHSPRRWWDQSGETTSCLVCLALKRQAASFFNDINEIKCDYEQVFLSTSQRVALISLIASGELDASLDRQGTLSPINRVSIADVDRLLRWLPSTEIWIFKSFIFIFATSGIVFPREAYLYLLIFHTDRSVIYIPISAKYIR